MAREKRRPRTNTEMLVTGLVAGGGFMAYWAFGGHQDWAIFAALFAGVLPAARGLTGLVAARRSAPALQKQAESERALETERSVLRVAREKGGRLTPALVALDCEIGMDEAERVLDGLARKGHASLQVREDGRIEYEFSEFMQPLLPR
jgi:hypothetical protein